MESAEQIRELTQKNNELASLNEHLLAQNQKLSETNNFNRKLLSLIAHDFREPIANIILLANLYQGGDISHETFDDLFNELQAATRNTLHSLDNMLLWIKSMFPEYKMAPEPVHIRSLLDKLEGSFEKQLESKQISLVIHCDETLTFMLEPPLIRYILKNILDNAIKFSHAGSSITVEATMPEDKKLQVVVEDHGVGMDERIRKQLFTPNQIVCTGTQREKGMGIALFLCKEFIEKYNGSITARSASGEGATFTIQLPSHSI